MSTKQLKAWITWITKKKKLRASAGCLFGLVVECATTRLSMQTGLISWTEPGTNVVQGTKLCQARML